MGWRQAAAGTGRHDSRSCETTRASTGTPTLATGPATTPSWGGGPRHSGPLLQRAGCWQTGALQECRGNAHCPLRCPAALQQNLNVIRQPVMKVIGTEQCCCCRVEELTDLGFEFDGEAAEWERWYNELSAFEVTRRLRLP
jgi:hypothetical protein